jgi:hypothetical protein
MSTADHAPGGDWALPRVLGRTAPKVAPALTESLLIDDVPDATADERADAAAEVRRGIAAMPDVLRAGLGLASRVVDAGLCALVRRRFADASPAVRAAAAQRVAGAGLPVTVEFARLSRALGLAAIYERRTPELLRCAPSGEPPSERSGWRGTSHPRSEREGERDHPEVPK